MNKIYTLVVITALLGGVVGSAATMMWLNQNPKTPTAPELIADFYRTENAVHVSPHSLRRRMDKGDDSFVLVDLRSAEEYKREHITGAINIPAYSDPNTSAYGDVDRIVSAFRDLPTDKEIIVYCYSTPCMTGRKIGAMLVEHNLFVKHLGIGWNEWRHQWTTWNHEHEWATTKPEDYITSGDQPGTPVLRDAPTPCGQGGFGC